MTRSAATRLILLTLLLTLASGAKAHAGQKSPHVAVLCAPFCTGSNTNGFWDELRRLGWTDGKNVIFDRKEAGSHLDQLPQLAADLVKSKPDLIVAISPQAARAAKNATVEIPIVFVLVADPIGMGLASSLSRPDGNVTGAATFVPGDFNGKAFEILRELLPHAKRVAAFVNPANETVQLAFMKEAPPAAAKLGFQIDVFGLGDPNELPGAVASAKARGADVMYIVPDAVFANPPNRMPDLASQAGLPSMSLERRFVQLGGLIAYGPDFPAVARLGAHYVDRILQGAKPGDLPIEQPSKFMLIINLKTAKSLGLEIPTSLLSSADEVIE